MTIKVPQYLLDSTKDDVDKMSEKDWEEYFENRKKYDRPLTDEERFELACKALECGKNKDYENLEFWSGQASTAIGAIAYKRTFGLKAVSKFNLYEAKKEYPDEF